MFSGGSTNGGGGWATTETQPQSGGWSSGNTGGDSDWQQMAAQMEATSISHDHESSRGDAPRPRRPRSPVDFPPPTPLEEAWPAFLEADESRDLDDVKVALAGLCNSFRGSSWQDVEKKLRDEGCNTYLTALSDKVMFGYTLVNLRDEPRQEYRVIASFIKPGSARSGRMTLGAASSYEENFERLARAGIVRPSGIPRCHNCKEDGHIANDCPQEKILPVKSEYFNKCYNCGSEDHRTRLCPEERKVTTCNNCQKEGHLSRDCPEPRAEMTCNRCGEVGHMSRDCTQPRTDITCNRCGEVGHMSRDCNQPRIDMTCNRCGEVGHMARDCDQPRVDVNCRRCGEPGHMSRDCGQARSAVCYRCGAEGHRSADCDSHDPNSTIDGQIRDVICHKCKEPGHMAFECPMRRQAGYGF
ncbi:hypothetical protein BGZ94_000793 [Podila epigama]|nr:hypothetical protein BGZ94_000793 [Podila epigama]